MRSNRSAWLLLALCLVGRIVWATPRAHAEAPVRVALRVGSDSDRALLPRLRGQLSDTNAQLVVVETPPLEAALQEQIAVASVLAKEHNADALVWCARVQQSGTAPAVQHLVHILLPRSERILTRELTTSTPGALSSGDLETAALLVRSALIALTKNAELGEVLAATSVNEAAPQQPESPATDPPPPTAAATDTLNRLATTDQRPDVVPASESAPRTSTASNATARDSLSQSAPPSAATSSPRESTRVAPSENAASRAAVSQRFNAPHVGTRRDGSASAPGRGAAGAAAGGEVSVPEVGEDVKAGRPARWVVGSSPSAAGGVDSALPELADAPGSMPAPLRARLGLGAQLAVDGQSLAGQRGLYASAGLSAGHWALSVFGAVSLASELADEFFALNVARHAVGVSVERQVPLADAWSFGLAAHAGALLLRRTSLAKSSAVVSYPASLIAAFAFGPELALSWLHDLFGVVLRVGLDILPDAPRFESAGLSPQHARIAHPLWTVQPRVALGWEIALP